MKNKIIVAELVDFYWELDDTIESMAGNVDVDDITALKDLQIKLDTILTNSSKRWAKGLRDPKPVHDTANTL